MMNFGGAERDRTADLVNAIHALSQLSYGPDLGQAPHGRTGKRLCCHAVAGAQPSLMFNARQHNRFERARVFSFFVCTFAAQTSLIACVFDDALVMTRNANVQA